MNQEILSLRRDAPELKSILFAGEVLRHGELWVALPREVVASPSGVDSIIFEVIPREGIERPSFFRVWLQAIRVENLALSFLPALTVFCWGLNRHWTLSWGVGGLAVLGVLLLHTAFNLFNDIEDHLRLIDLPGQRGGSGVIQKGWMSGRELKPVAFGFLVLGVLCGVPAVLQSPTILMVIALLGTCGGISYSNKPFEMKYHALGDFAFFLLFGPILTLGFSQAFFHQFDFSVLGLGFFFGFLAEAIYHLNNLQDIEADLLNRVSTLASRMGFKRSRHLLLSVYVFALLSLIPIIIWGGLPSLVLGFLLLGVGSMVKLLLRVYKAAGPASALLSLARFDAAKIHAILALLICLGLLSVSW